MNALFLLAVMLAAQPAEVCLTSYFNFACEKPQEDDIYQDWTFFVHDVVKVELLINRNPRVWRVIGTVHRMQECPGYDGDPEYYYPDYADDWWRDEAPGKFTAVPLKGEPFEVESLEEGARRLVELWTGRRVARLDAMWRSKQ